MSWAEVHKINETTMKNDFSNAYLIENSSTFTAPQTGNYKIIVVGAGGSSEISTSSGSVKNSASGGSGGVAVSIKRLTKDVGYTIQITNALSSFASTESTNSFTIQATAGTSGSASFSTATAGVGGTATGGDYNYAGNNGQTGGSSLTGASVGCFLMGLMTQLQKDKVYYDNATYTATAISGYGILNHGAGSGIEYNNTTAETPKQNGCVLIIPYVGI